ncbi:oligosaccharide flippase family protein [Dyadobacter sp. 3J3]|uniref:oligosaccharide flippase family protein n=1 Tax=Dyadobacter sp. 3J3 TaxID=2606600 RepID=UPI001357351C|nr:oligosaccharide flippase family protein [Dyadobacter sp. 3J3]
MKNRLISIIQKLDIDSSIFWSVVNRGLGVIRAPLTIFFIVKYLSTEEQGTWYTFTSLGALTMLADLGFATITTQFVSHEYAHLRFEGDLIAGDDDRLDRFIAFIYFSVKFYIKVSLAAIAILIGAGVLYFGPVDTHLLFIWIAYSFIGGLGMLTAMFQAIYQGLNKVKEIHINILFNSFLVTFFTCLTLFLGFKIWALVIGIFLGTLLATIGLFRMGKAFWTQVYSYRIKDKYNFLDETLSLQVRYAVSFIATYLIAFLYVPAIYKFVGAKEAGQVGLIISVMIALSSVAYSWTQTKIPTFNILVSQNKTNELDLLVKKATIQSAFVFITLSILLVIIVSVMPATFLAKYATRIPDIEIIILYIFSQFSLLLLNSLTIYLRAFKKEPLMNIQVLSSILLLISIGFILKRGLGLYTFLLSVNLYSWAIVMPLAYFVFQKNRKLLTKKLI